MNVFDFRKQKTPLSPGKRQRCENILCGTTLLAGAYTPTTQGLPGNGGGRRNLLPEGFGPLLRGDIRRPFLSALHQTAALCAGTGSATDPHLRILRICPNILSAPRGIVKDKVAQLRHFWEKKGAFRAAISEKPHFLTEIPKMFKEI